MSKYEGEWFNKAVADYKACNGEYEAEQAVLKEAIKFKGVTLAGIRQRFVRDGIYNAKPTAKESKGTVRKAELVTQLAKLTGIDEDVLGTFEKANRKPLELVVGRFRAMVEANTEVDAEVEVE